MDATGAARSILLAINRTWAAKQGEFFVESPINLLAAVIWFLRRYKEGQFCTLPHAIELLQLPYDNLFTVLNTEPEISALVKPVYRRLSGRCDGNPGRPDSVRQDSPRQALISTTVSIS